MALLGELSDVFDCPSAWRRACGDKSFSMDMRLSEFLVVYREHWNDVHSKRGDEFCLEGLLTQDDIDSLIKVAQNGKEGQGELRGA